MSKRLRRVFLTWNNWQEIFNTKEDVKQYFEELPHIKGAIIGFEVGEKKETPHLQAVVSFSIQKSFNTLREYFKNNHIERVISLQSSIEYCKKENDYIEIGDISKQGQRTDLFDFKDAIIDGYTDLELLEQYTNQYLKYEPMIDKIRQLANNEYYSKNNRDNIKVIYIGGKAGSGKTSLVYELFNTNNVYRVGNYKNPFDQYKGQKSLVLDEYNGQLSDDLMLNILDRYPLLLPARYNDKWATFDTVIILSNYPYNEIFYRSNVEISKAFDRRFTYIDYMNNNNRQDIKDKINQILLEDKELPF